jgi:hypothetical protein
MIDVTPADRGQIRFVLDHLRDFAWRTDIARFMTLIGAQPEAVLRGYGVHGEDFISYRWLADEHGSTLAEEHHATH